MYPEACSTCQETQFDLEPCNQCWDAITFSQHVGDGPRRGQPCTLKLDLPANAMGVTVGIQSEREKRGEVVPDLDLVIFRYNYMNISNVIGAHLRNFGAVRKTMAQSVVLPTARRDRLIEFLQPKDVKNLAVLCKVRRKRQKGITVVSIICPQASVEGLRIELFFQFLNF